MFSSKLSFVMTAVGAAVGLGNIFRFPYLAVQYGLGFVLVYIMLLAVLGLPLLISEVAFGRGLHKTGHEDSKFSLLKGLWSANSLVIMCYYSVLFSFVISAVFFSYKLTANASASSFWGLVYGESSKPFSALFLLFAWGAVLLCFGDAKRLGKISVFSVFCSIFIILALATFRGLSNPSALLPLIKMDFSVLLLPRFWLDATSQVFFSLSLAVGVLAAYGGCLKASENIASCGILIAFFDLAVSLAASVIYATVEAKSEGLLSSFSVYPKAFSSFGFFAAPVCFLFYLSVAFLCLDSVFSYLKSAVLLLFPKYIKSENTAAFLLALLCGFLGLFLLGDGVLHISFIDTKVTPVLVLSAGIYEVLFFSKWAVKATLFSELNFPPLNSKKSKGFSLLLFILAPIILILLLLTEIFL